MMAKPCVIVALKAAAVARVARVAIVLVEKFMFPDLWVGECVLRLDDHD